MCLVYFIMHEINISPNKNNCPCYHAKCPPLLPVLCIPRLFSVLCRLLGSSHTPKTIFSVIKTRNIYGGGVAIYEAMLIIAIYY